MENRFAESYERQLLHCVKLNCGAVVVHEVIYNRYIERDFSLSFSI